MQLTNISLMQVVSSADQQALSALAMHAMQMQESVTRTNKWL
jgi:hypothetical protein